MATTLENTRQSGGKKVILAEPRGFCAGVRRAIEIVERALELHGAPVYVRKQIVHNEHVVRELEERGARFVDSETEVPDGAVCIFSAHGVSPQVRDNAAERNLTVIDATCPLVAKVHQEARRYARDGRTLILVGHADHEEIEGTFGEAPERTVIVQDAEEARRLDLLGGRECQLSHPDHAVARRHRGDRLHPPRALLPADRSWDRRRLLRQPEPAELGEVDRRPQRPGAGGRFGQLQQHGADGGGLGGQPAPGRTCCPTPGTWTRSGW